MPSPHQQSFVDLGRKLVEDGPVKSEPARRRVRGQLAGQWVFDSLDTLYVWEHPYYPAFFVPQKAIESGPGELREGTDGDKGDGFWTGKLVLDGGGHNPKEADVLVLEKGKLAGFVRFATPSYPGLTQLDAWFAEDEKLLGPHPKDPYKRIECLPSSREVRIEVRGVVIARCTNNVFLHETGLRVRYYLLPTAVLDWSVLVPSATTSFCPYKGQAQYYDLAAGGGKDGIEDVVWYYEYPTAESQAIQGRLCFYNEKVDVFIDGTKESV